MKLLFRIIGILVLLIVLFVLYTFYTTGFFRKINGSFQSYMVDTYYVPGAEDIVMDDDGTFLIISADDRKNHTQNDREKSPCGLYYLDLQTNELRLLDHGMDHELHPHGIDIMEIDSGIYRLLIVNHIPKNDKFELGGLNVDHYIEEFILENKRLHYVKSYSDEHIHHPNDVAIIDQLAFYYTNDHGSHSKIGIFMEDYLGLRRSNVVFYDGDDFIKVADDIAYANGIALDLSRDLLFVASPRDFLIKVYSIKNDDQLEYIEDIDCGTGVDNITLDASGSLWVGCHPDLLHFTAYASGSKDISPSEIIQIKYRDTGDYELIAHMEDNGSIVSGATVVVPYEDYLFVGNVMDARFVKLRRP